MGIQDTRQAINKKSIELKLTRFEYGSRFYAKDTANLLRESLQLLGVHAACCCSGLLRSGRRRCSLRLLLLHLQGLENIFHLTQVLRRVNLLTVH